MKFHQANAEIFVPDGVAEALALSRTTRLGIGAHQDDLEFMAFHGILACHEDDSEWFAGVTCTNGAGSARCGRYSGHSDAQMREVRCEEQRRAAQIGRYGAMIQLDFSSAVVKDRQSDALRNDLIEVLRATRPRMVYTHHPADKHETHVATAMAVIQAIRALPVELRPETVHGCEVWRSLDWLPDADKVVHDLSGGDELAAALVGVFDSQIAGGKRYDLGVLGRRRANATFHESHHVDRADSIAFAMDLTPLIRDESQDVAAYVDGIIGRFRDDVLAKMRFHLNR